MDQQAVSDVDKPAGDQAGIVADWMREHGEAVYDLLLRLCRNRHDAEDLRQETFLRALKRLDSFQAGSNARAWLMRIASNAYMDLYRSRRSARTGPLEMDVGHDGDPSRPIETEELAKLVARAIDDLPEPARVVFLLRTREELPFSEIAAVIQTTEETARWHMMKARRQLLASLEGKL